MAKTQIDVTWLTVNEAADYLRMSRGSFYKRYAEGRIPGYRMFGEGPLRFKRADLDALMVPVEAGLEEDEDGE